MFQSISRSWKLYKLCWGVLIHDKELLLFPAFSFVSLLLIAGTIFGSGMFQRVSESIFAVRLMDLVLILILYFVNYFIIIYFNAAIIGAARIRLNGGDPTLSDGFNAATRNLIHIISWAFISAIVNVIFYALEKAVRGESNKRSGVSAIVLGMLASVARIGWSIITYLVIPIMVVEGVGPVEAIKRSAQMIKNTWGEQLISRVGFDLIAMIIGLPIVVLMIVIGKGVPGTLGTSMVVAIGVLGLGSLTLITSAMKGIYAAALYEYANSGSVPELFDREMITDSWQTSSSGS